MFDLDSSSVVWSLIGLFVSRCKLVSSSVVMSLFKERSGIQSISTLLSQCWNFGSSLVDREFEKEQLKTLLLGSQHPIRGLYFCNLLMEQARINAYGSLLTYITIANAMVN